MELENFFPDLKEKAGYNPINAPKLREVLKQFEGNQSIKDLDEIAKELNPQQRGKLYSAVKDILSLCIRNDGLYYDHEGLANINYFMSTYFKRMCGSSITPEDSE